MDVSQPFLDRALALLSRVFAAYLWLDLVVRFILDIFFSSYIAFLLWKRALGGFIGVEGMYLCSDTAVCVPYVTKEGSIPEDQSMDMCAFT